LGQHFALEDVEGKVDARREVYESARRPHRSPHFRRDSTGGREALSNAEIAVLSRLCTNAQVGL
jgi:hypothetical protein